MERMDTLNQRVAEEIRVLLARRRLTATELARMTGMTQRSISRRITGEKKIDVDDLQRIADALDVDLYDLLPARARTSGGGSSGDIITVRSAPTINPPTPGRTDKRELVDSRYGSAMSMTTHGRPQRLSAATADSRAHA
jgi:transcriptional regulator with XRE-family HTH domain